MLTTWWYYGMCIATRNEKKCPDFRSTFLMNEKTNPFSRTQHKMLCKWTQFISTLHTLDARISLAGIRTLLSEVIILDNDPVLILEPNNLKNVNKRAAKTKNPIDLMQYIVYY